MPYMQGYRTGGRLMKVRIKYYAKYRETTGKKEEEMEISSLTIGELIEVLKKKYPSLANERGSIIAVNNRFTKDDIPLSDGDVVSFFPPVSGG
jgi:MoaD family protein